MAASLNQQTVLDAAPQALIYHRRPDGVIPGVVHLGLGGFHRAHQAMVFDALIARGDHRWGVCAVGMRSDKLASQLQAQDYLYLMRVSDEDGSRWQAISSIIKTLVAATARDEVIAQIANPQTRWLTLTVTEKAYTDELARLIVDGLAKRHRKDLSGLTIASCDNLPDNGHVLQALCLKAAQDPAFDAGLANWIDTECRFPSSMVDGIVPAPSAEVREAGQRDLSLDDPTALGVESYWEWVIEDKLVDPADADALRAVGVEVSNNVAGFEQAKLWMLNGSHTVLASAGAVLGDAYIRQVIARPVMKRFIHGYMSHASGPLVGRPNWQGYRDALIKRFMNPMLDHACLQVYSDSSFKIPVRWVPVGERLLQTPSDKREGLDHLAMAVAIFARSLWPVTEAGQAFVFHDSMATELQALAADQASDPDGVMRRLLNSPDATSASSAGVASVFGHKLGLDQGFVQAASHRLARIHALGLEAALEEFLG